MNLVAAVTTIVLLLTALVAFATEWRKSRAQTRLVHRTAQGTGQRPNDRKPPLPKLRRPTQTELLRLPKLRRPDQTERHSSEHAETADARVDRATKKETDMQMRPVHWTVDETNGDWHTLTISGGTAQNVRLSLANALKPRVPEGPIDTMRDGEHARFHASCSSQSGTRVVHVAWDDEDGTEREWSYELPRTR